MVKRSVEQIADLLHSASIHLLRRVREEDVHSGLSAARLSTLSVLVFRGPLTLGQLAAAEGVRAPTMSSIVSGLEEAGLARRSPQPQDGRIKLVEVTEQGEQLLQEARRRRIERICAALREIDARDLEAVARGAETVERLLGAPDRPWRPVDMRRGGHRSG